MNERRPTTHKGDCARCLLCNRLYCERHKGKELDVCEIDHFTYWSKSRHHREHGPNKVFASMEERRKTLGDERDDDRSSIES